MLFSVVSNSEENDTCIPISFFFFFNHLTFCSTVRYGFDFKSAFFHCVLLISISISLYDNALTWMSQSLTYDKPKWVQVMACCCQATSHYLSQCWPRLVSWYSITRPQWVNYIPRIRRIGGCYGFTSKPPAARNGVNAITQKPRYGLFTNLVYTLVVIVSWPD